MFEDNVGGIWQPRDIDSYSAHIRKRLFCSTGLHGADIDLDITNSDEEPQHLGVLYQITSTQDGVLIPMKRL